MSYRNSLCFLLEYICYTWWGSTFPTKKSLASDNSRSHCNTLHWGLGSKQYATRIGISFISAIWSFYPQHASWYNAQYGLGWNSYEQTDKFIRTVFCAIIRRYLPRPRCVCTIAKGATSNRSLLCILILRISQLANCISIKVWRRCGWEWRKLARRRTNKTS